MIVNKKLLAGAIAGLLVSANAGAVVLGTDPARRYAAEMQKPVALTDAADTVEFALGYNFSPSEVRYGRFECTSNIEINNPVVTSPSADTYTESRSRTTQQNLAEAKLLMDAHGLRSAILVSDPLHMRRAMWMARELGIAAVSSPTPTTRYRSLKTKLRFLRHELYYWHHYAFSGG